MNTTKTKTYSIPELWMELKDRTLLAALMDKQSVSARRLALVAGWKSHTYMQRLLRGEAKTLETDPALRIAHHLGVPFDLLFVTRLAENVGQSARESRAA